MVVNYLHWARSAGIGWSLAEGFAEMELEVRLFPPFAG
jgi:hypothetical protein